MIINEIIKTFFPRRVWQIATSLSVDIEMNSLATARVFISISTSCEVAIYYINIVVNFDLLSLSVYKKNS